MESKWMNDIVEGTTNNNHLFAHSYLVASIPTEY